MAESVCLTLACAFATLASNIYVTIHESPFFGFSSEKEELINFGKTRKAVKWLQPKFLVFNPRGGYSPKIPIRVCAAQRGRDFGTPYLERGIHFRDVS